MESARPKAKNKRVAHIVPALSSRGFLKHKANLYPSWDSPEEDKKIEDMFEDLDGIGPEWTAIHDILKSENRDGGKPRHSLAKRPKILIFETSPELKNL